MPSCRNATGFCSATGACYVSRSVASLEENVSISRHSGRPEPHPSDVNRPRLVSGFGLFVGFTLFAASLTPSLVPRVAVVQGLLGGTLFAFGYILAVAAIVFWRWLELPEPRRSLANVFAALSALGGLALALVALGKAAEWQNSIRELMSLPPVDTAHPMKVALVAGATAIGLLLVAYLIRLLFRRIKAKVGRVVSERLAMIVGVTVAFALLWALVEGVVVRFTLHTLDQSYAALDALVEPDIDAPLERWRTGGPGSLISWDDLGRAGRRFVARAPTGAEIGDFWHAPASEPLRVYVGLATSDDPYERAQLALEELKRVGGFDRDVLIVGVPTGTGYMEDGAITTLEYLFKGDVATVATQYSYLQSPFSLIFEPGYGAQSARALLRTIYDHWTELDPDERPRLYLHGVSLGALSSEQSMRLYEVLGDPINGAVWSGPPFPSPTHRAATEDRNESSSAWLPELDDGRFIRFTRDGSNLDPDAPWGPMRILYMQHPSDPIVFFDFATLWRAPDWLEEERGPDVSPLVRWYPVVTALQIAADMALSNEAPPGHGHQYAANTYIDAWMAVTDPPVSADDVARLKTFFSNGVPPRGTEPPPARSGAAAPDTAPATDADAAPAANTGAQPVGDAAPTEDTRPTPGANAAPAANADPAPASNASPSAETEPAADVASDADAVPAADAGKTTEVAPAANAMEPDGTSASLDAHSDGPSDAQGPRAAGAE